MSLSSERLLSESSERRSLALRERVGDVGERGLGADALAVIGCGAGNGCGECGCGGAAAAGCVLLCERLIADIKSGAKGKCARLEWPPRTMLTPSARAHAL